MFNKKSAPGHASFTYRCGFVYPYFEDFIFLADDNNTRVLFEKVLSSMPKDKARFVKLQLTFFLAGCSRLLDLIFNRCTD